MKFKKGKVWVHVGEDDAPMLVNGSAEFRYKLDDHRTYNTSQSFLESLDAPEHAPEPERPVEAQVEKTPDTPKAVSGRGRILAWTDGACSGNPGPGGFGVVLIWGKHRKEWAGYLGEECTNNIAELSAIKHALEQITNRALPVDIHTDSNYSLGVLAKGWKAKANTELVEEIRTLLAQFAQVNFIKVAGHAGVPENERVDELARLAVSRRFSGEVKE